MAENVEQYFDSLSLQSVQRRTKPKLGFGTAQLFVSVCALVDSRLKDCNRSQETKQNDIKQMIKFLHVILEIFENESTESKEQYTESSFDFQPVFHCVESISKFGQVGEFKGIETNYTEEDFEGVVDKCSDCMQCFGILFTVFQDDIFADSRRTLTDSLGLHSTVLSIEHQQKHQWTSSSSESLSSQLLDKILKCYKCDSPEKLFEAEQSQKLVKHLMMKIETKMTRKLWKHNPTIKHIYEWCLLNMKSGVLSDLLDKMLPPSLLLLDDHELENKLLGIKCMNHIIENTSKTELTWLGRSEVIYDSLQKLMYTHDPAVISALHPCLLKVLFIIEPDPKRGDTPRKHSRFDDVFHRFLNDMELENKIVLRRSYTYQLPRYVQSLGITALKHVKIFLSVIFGYLDVYDGPKEEARANILRSLQVFITECWPRVPNHCEAIVKGLVKFIYDMSVDRSLTPDAVNEALVKQAQDCLVLMKRICPEKVSELLAAVQTVGLGDECDESIKAVLSAK